MVSKMPPVDMMSAEDQARIVEEDVVPETSRNGRVASTVSQLMPSSSDVRFREETIVGLEAKVRFRSLTARHFLELSEDSSANILKHSICDENGDLFLTDEDVKHLNGSDNDARTYLHLIEVANDHCLAGATLEGLTEAAAKNSVGPTSTSAD